MPGSEYFVPSEDSSFGWYLFADAEVRAVAQNIFLDGNTWKDSYGVEKEDFVGDVQAGVAFSVGDYRVAYTHVFRTKEFKSQNDNIETFGGVTITMRF